MSLTALAIKAAKPQKKVYKLSDAKGLHIRVATSGAKYSRMNYRFAGKFKTLALGAWPETGLAEARAKSDPARKLLEGGIDPNEKAILDRISASIASANTFGMVAQEWIEKTRKDGFSAVTLQKNQ